MTEVVYLPSLAEELTDLHKCIILRGGKITVFFVSTAAVRAHM